MALLVHNFSDGFVSANREKIGVISQRSQRILFEEIVYLRYEASAQKQYESNMASDSSFWGKLDGRVRDIAVDLVYQQGSIWKRQLPYIFSNDPVLPSEYIKTHSN